MPSFNTLQSPIFPWHLHPMQLLALGKNWGLDENAMLGICELTPQDLNNRELLISTEQYFALAEYIEEHCNIADWGLQLGQRLTLTSHGKLGLAVMSCRDLEQALTLAIQYKHLVTTFFQFDIWETDDQLVLNSLPEISRHRYHHAFVACFFVGLYLGIKQLVGADQAKAIAQNTQIHFSTPEPEFAESYHAIFEQQVHFNAPVDQLRFPKSILHTPLGGWNQATVESLSAEFDQASKSHPPQLGLLVKLRQQFAQGNHSLEGCAEALNSSATTLKRYLQQADTRFINELNNYRFLEACKLLEGTQVPLENIADTLKYSDISAFRRAFKQWSGKTPAEYRNDLQTARSDD